MRLDAMIIGLLGSLAMLGTLGIVLSAGDVSAFQSHRTPVPPTPVDDPAPKVACPDDFRDGVASFSGKGEDANYYYIALGIAEAECGIDEIKDVPFEQEELAKNKAKCEAVPGCKLSYETIYESCEGSFVDCQPLTGDVGPFKCEVAGKLDFLGYKCEKETMGPPAEFG